MNMKFATRLAALRRANGFSQEELAERLNITSDVVDNWENGASTPDNDNLVALSSLYCITMDELVNGGDANVDIAVEEGEVLDPEEAENRRMEDEDEPRRKIKVASLISSAAFILCTIAYLLCGFLWKGNSGNLGWASMWILFLVPIIITSLYMAIREHKFGNFQITLFVIGVYCGMGIIAGDNGLNLWHPFWVLFLLIPIYHSVAGVIDNHRGI